MHRHHPRAIATTIACRQHTLLAILAEAVLGWFVARLAYGELAVKLPDGTRLVFSGRRAGLQARVRLHRWRALLRLAWSGAVGFAEGYIAGDWSSPDLAALLTVAAQNRDSLEPFAGMPAPRLRDRLRHAINRNTRGGSRRNIAAHYDLGNAFYRHWLDAGMTYSSALFSSRVQSLEQAQAHKLDRVIEWLDPAGGEHVLEIGCGWGSLAERLLDFRDCRLTGITLSTEQLAYGEARLGRHVRTGRCELRLQDYRDLRETFDRIVSIEMLEAVGEAYWPTYFRVLHDRLRPGGVAVLQVITIAESRFSAYRRRPDFIQKHVFPGGMLPTTRIIEQEAARAGLELTQVELFADSYVRTLQEWNVRFQRAWGDIAALGFDARFKRKWEFYLAYCEAGFATGALDVGLYRLVRQAPAPLSHATRAAG